jgi:hypothetical protein
LRIERQITESHLATARAQIDPDRLLTDLKQVRDLYGRGMEDADAALDALIASLRRVREPTP